MKVGDTVELISNWHNGGHESDVKANRDWLGRQPCGSRFTISAIQGHDYLALAESPFPSKPSHSDARFKLIVEPPDGEE